MLPVTWFDHWQSFDRYILLQTLEGLRSKGVMLDGKGDTFRLTSQFLTSVVLRGLLVSIPPPPSPPPPLPSLFTPPLPPPLLTSQLFISLFLRGLLVNQLAVDCVASGQSGNRSEVSRQVAASASCLTRPTEQFLTSGPLGRSHTQPMGPDFRPAVNWVVLTSSRLGIV